MKRAVPMLAIFGAVVLAGAAACKKPLPATPAGEAVRLPAGTLGVVRVFQHQGDTYDVQIVFPVDFTADAAGKGSTASQGNIPVELGGPIVLFDEKGPLGALRVGSGFRVDFWCQNDGGLHYRPALRTAIREADLDRKLASPQTNGGIAGFAVIAEPGAKPIAPATGIAQPGSGGEARLKGDSNGDGTAEALVMAVPLDKACGGGAAEAMLLRSPAGDHLLDCCGP